LNDPEGRTGQDFRCPQILAVRSPKAVINVFGSGGHSFIGAEEMFYRGWLGTINPIFETGVSMPPGALRSTAIERHPAICPASSQRMA
jgi:uncharacterized phosphosugar-binding protein